MKIIKLLLITTYIIINCAETYESNGHNNLQLYCQLYALSEGNGRAWYPSLKMAIKDFCKAIELFIEQKKYAQAETILGIIGNHFDNLETNEKQETKELLIKFKLIITQKTVKEEKN
jgi:hypothetical protein